MNMNNVPCDRPGGNACANVNENEDRLGNLAAAVFGNELLFDKIIKDVLANPDHASRNEDIQSLRLVQRKWRDTVTKIHRISRLPLFKLMLDAENSVVAALTEDFKENGKLLHQFVTYVSGSRAAGDIPPFSMRIMPSFFCQENYFDFANCLMSCGAGLVNLNLSIPVNSSLIFAFYPFALPNLQKLTVTFSNFTVANMLVGGHWHTIYPLQEILNAAEGLKEFSLNPKELHNMIPWGIEYVCLPPALSRLRIGCVLGSGHLAGLLRSSLPNLSALTLYAGRPAYADGLIYQLLEKFKGTLKTLALSGDQCQGRAMSTTRFKFPVMEKLQAIMVSSQYWELEGDSVSNTVPGWHSRLTVLKELNLYKTTDTMLRNWTGQSQFQSVDTLCVSLIDVRVFTLFHPQHAENPMTLTLERMRAIHSAFPSVTNLKICLSGLETSGLAYIFKEMRQLRHLSIVMLGQDHQNHPVFWDSQLIGAPPDITASLIRNRNFWNAIHFTDMLSAYPSIRTLTELKSLTLMERFIWTEPPAGAQAKQGWISLISDVTFHFALLLMSNLKDLTLSGKFRVTKDMSQKWTATKGTRIRCIT